MLRRRINRQRAAQREAQQGMAPLQGSHPDPGSFGGVSATMPTAVISYLPEAVGGTGTLVMEEAEVMYAADGAPYLATRPAPPGAHAAVAAGNPREGAASATRARAQRVSPGYGPSATGQPYYAADGAPYASGTAVYRGPGA